MELLFLWIEDFRNIQKQGFTFSSELKFEVTQLPDKNNLNSYNIAISYNKEYVDLFDGNIINVTGIVGKNGAGKSSLLHCLKLMCGKLSILTSSLVFSILDKENKIIKTYYYKDGGVDEMVSLSVSIEIDKLAKNKYNISKPIPYKVDRFNYQSNIGIDGLDFKFSDIACCYFSNTFDSHRENIYEGIYNVSTNYRVEDFLKKYIESIDKTRQRKKQKDITKIEPWPSHIFQYHKYELKTLLRFISYANTRKSSILPDLPKVLNIDFNYSDYEYLINEAPSSFLYSINILQNIHKLALDLILKSKDKRNNFLNNIVLCSFYFFLRQELVNPDNFNMDDMREGISKLLDNPDFLFKNIRKLLAPLNTKEDDSSKLKTISEFLGQSFTKSMSKIEFSDTELPSDNKVHYRLKINNNLWSVLSLINDLKSLDDSTFIDYSWGSGLSSGEEAFLTHFARLNEIKSKVNYKPIWLFIDEGDLYFHPQWQKEYFSHLINYVKFLFPRNKVQIIISTHSPFIVSDLPKQNLIFLKKNIEGNCMVSDNDIQNETFGSNIHELFTNSFFLSDGLMGEFARKKIEELIKDINIKEYISSDEYETNYKNRISLIGESFIRAKLFEIIANKSDVNIIDEIIKQRNNEIELLNQIKRKKTNDKDR
jgi:hypothetical protein